MIAGLNRLMDGTVLTLSSLDFLLTRAGFAGTVVTKLSAHRSSTLLSAFNPQAISYQC
jgi:hypothetical protein